MSCRNSIKGPAANVLLIFLCLVLTTAAIAMLMFRGVYDFENYYIDTQFQDFYQSSTTMFIYLISGDNYTDAASAVMPWSSLYTVFFMCCTIVGLFFLSALLIEAYCGSFDDAYEVVQVYLSDHRKYSIALATVIWARHSHSSNAIYGPKRNVTDAGHYNQVTNQVLDSSSTSN